jgi:hypothetical protein
MHKLSGPIYIWPRIKFQVTNPWRRIRSSIPGNLTIYAIQDILTNLTKENRGEKHCLVMRPMYDNVENEIWYKNVIKQNTFDSVIPW